MDYERDWIHAEAPNGEPSAAAYRMGCRCSECKLANSAYMKAYRERRVGAATNGDGTAMFHNHSGRPSTRTALKNLCVHPRCLKLAGLELRDGLVVFAPNGAIEPTFAAAAVPKAVA